MREVTLDGVRLDVSGEEYGRQWSMIEDRLVELIENLYLMS